MSAGDRGVGANKGERENWVEMKKRGAPCLPDTWDKGAFWPY